jgi:KDO2-lipid IV(A) lauroyltransferase
MGGEWLARKFSMPVFFLNVDKIGHATYTCNFECIYDGVEEVAEGEITRRYVEHLEVMIRRAPHLWMWSHRRWKHIDIAEDEARAAQNTK